MSRSNRSNSTRPFYRVKVINGMCSMGSSTQTDSSQLLNVLNWSALESFDCVRIFNTDTSADKDENNGSMNAVQTSIELQRRMLNLKSMFIDPSGRLVNYRQLATNGLFNDLCDLAKHLTTISLDNVTENERKTFFINLYNLLTIHGVTKLSDFPKSVLDLNQFSKTTSYKIGPHVYSLDDIEHGILRGNKPHSNCTQRHFTFNDPRAKYAMRRCDPRIHFALNCAARSSPSIVIYSSTNLEKTLNMVTSSHCNMEIDVELDNAQVHLSKLFLWYRSDFGRSDLEVLRWITKYIDEPKRSSLRTLIDQQNANANLRLSYKTYDWMLNNHEATHSRSTDVDRHP